MTLYEWAWVLFPFTTFAFGMLVGKLVVRAEDRRKAKDTMEELINDQMMKQAVQEEISNLVVLYPKKDGPLDARVSTDYRFQFWLRYLPDGKGTASEWVYSSKVPHSADIFKTLNQAMWQAEASMLASIRLRQEAKGK